MGITQYYTWWYGYHSVLNMVVWVSLSIIHGGMGIIQYYTWWYGNHSVLYIVVWESFSIIHSGMGIMLGTFWTCFGLFVLDFLDKLLRFW